MFFVKPIRRMAWLGSCRLGLVWCELGGAVGLSGAEHGQDDVAAAAGQTDEGGVVAFAFGAFTVVEGSGGWIAEAGEGGEEHGVFEPVVAASAAGLSGQGGTGLAGDRGQAGVGGELAAVTEGGAVADLGEDPGAGAWPDPGRDASSSPKG